MTAPASGVAAAPAAQDDPRTEAFYARSVHAVAEAMVGCVLRHGETAGRIVETESYHQEEAACHAHIGLTGRTRTLFMAPGTAYVYRSYGIHALLNAVGEEEGTGAAVLVRALEPLEGVALMRRRRGHENVRALCSGPGKLTQALGMGLELNATSLVHGPIEVLPRPAVDPAPQIFLGERIGITKAVELPWRFCDASRSRFVSRPLPSGMRRTSR